MYNVKVIHYPNGEMQLRHYSTPLVLKESSPYEEEHQEREYENYERNPFDNKLSRIVDDFAELDSITKENERRSYNRTKQNIFAYSRCALWEKFVTFTFNGDLVDRYNFDECSKLVRQWLHNQRRNAPDLQYLIVPELHKDGAIHFHGLLAQTENMIFKDSGKRTKDKKIIYNMSKWKYGFTTAIDVYNVHGVSKYIGKYITKELCDITKGKHRYFVSNNLQEPTKETFLVSAEEFNGFLIMYTDSLGVEIKHISKPRIEHSFVDVDYYELQELEDYYDGTTSI